jgi:nucleoside-diphosphate-sugar epimerase
MVELMEANPLKLKHRNAYNITAMNFTPEKLAEQIRKSIPNFEMEYQVDPARQAIADSWPDYMDDSKAREEWGWKPEYSIETMTKEMLSKLSKKIHRTDRPSSKRGHASKITKIARGG